MFDVYVLMKLFPLLQIWETHHSDGGTVGGRHSDRRPEPRLVRETFLQI